ncbi:MAG: imidazoleglycerol-phosphate dehydratase HisB, partial [Deltaproteobacteria bacterium]|nr:imidazoleglycerol-phosphate dehydratase HisB [Deltaproteobacteria bacterium]
YATKETRTTVRLNLDGTGQAEIGTGIAFFDHMLEQLTFHGLFDLKLECRGDLEVDGHHTVEDVGIALGRAIDQALGERTGIRRFGEAHVPMDETLARVALDFSGRPEFHFQGSFSGPRVGEMDTQLVTHFFKSLAMAARLTLHMALLYGENDHHKAEGLFKALGRALDQALTADPRRRGVSSTKGTL